MTPMTTTKPNTEIVKAVADAFSSMPGDRPLVMHERAVGLTLSGQDWSRVYEIDPAKDDAVKIETGVLQQAADRVRVTGETVTIEKTVTCTLEPMDAVDTGVEADDGDGRET